MKKLTVLCFLLVTLASCTVGDGNRIPYFPDLPDAATTVYTVDSGPPCDRNDTSRLRTDFHNCGACGRYCSSSDADRCVNGSCRCGNGPPCGEGADCRMGTCVRADRFTECTSVEDCNAEGTTARQNCIANPISGRSYCVDICEFDDACPAGFNCIEGACTFLTCVAEACDDLDNDCDGEVDENGDSTGPLSRWCFSGPDIADINPPCRKGVQICEIGGTWSEREGEIPPIPETGLLACNMRDDDCDGCVDGAYIDGSCVMTEPNGFDILYLIDISGSMSSTISAVITATSSFSAIYAGNPEFRFALVLISGSGGRDGRAFVEVDFADFTRFNSSLARLTATGGGSEPTWDAVYESVTGEIAHGVDINGDDMTDIIDETRMGLSWRDGSIRILVMFGDETAQTTRSDRGLSPVMESQMCDTLTHGESLTVFGTRANRVQFDDCATHHEISSDPEVMVERLGEIIVDPCL